MIPASLIQKVLDDLTNTNADLQYFLAQKNNQQKCIEINITDFQQKLILKVLPGRLLLVDANSGIADVSLKARLNDLLKLRTLDKVTPAELHALNVELDGDLGLLQRFSSAVKTSSITDIVYDNLSRLTGDLPARQLLNLLQIYKVNTAKSADSLKQHLNYIKTLLPDEIRSVMDKPFVSKAEYETLQENIYQQHLLIQKLSNEVEQLKSKLIN